MNPESTPTSRKSQTPQIGEADLKAAAYLVEAHRRMIHEMGRVIVGQADVLDQMLIALFCQGHCVLEGVPGLAKTLMISTLAQLLSLTFRRIQFTPDLMPSDITGTEFLEQDSATGHRRLKFVKGPIFTHVLLGDEINRTPPKTQAALLQAMQEYKVTVAGVDYPLERPFFVLGTQNPIEQEGTYPLPEAQLDRFMFKIHVNYPSYDEELSIAQTSTSEDRPNLQPLLTRDAIVKLQQIVRRVLVGQTVAAYAVQLVRATRPHQPDAPAFIKKYLTWGAGPRACQAMLLGAKARALLNGRYHVAVEDIRYVAAPVLRHRLVTSFSAEADGISADEVIKRLCNDIPEPAEL
jgi:MoxR-like ATPase